MYIGKPFYLKVKINCYMIAFLFILFLENHIVEGLAAILIVLLHEFTHLIVASKYGIKANEIELFPFGGIVKLDGIFAPEPIGEIFICLSGPLFNLIMSLCLITINYLFSNMQILSTLININLMMFLLNILPIFPLDGGKIFRAILSFLWGYKKATLRMIKFAYFISTIIIIIGLVKSYYNYNNLYIVTLATFVLIAARNEKKMAAFIFITNIAYRQKSYAKRKVMKAQFIVCLKNITAKEILDYFLPYKYHIIIVIDEKGDYKGTVNEKELIDAIMIHGIDINLENLLFNSK